MKKSVFKKKRPIKIVILIDAWYPVFGGGQVHVSEISKRLVKDKRCQIEIITSKLGMKNVKNEKITNNDYFKIIRLGPAFSFENLFGRIFYLFFALFYLLFNDYDIIHAHAFLPGIPAKLASIIKRKPVVFTVHGIVKNSWDEISSYKIISYFYRWIENLILFNLHYDFQISVSEDFLRYKNVNKKIEIIPNGVDVKIFNSVKTIKDKDFKIIFVGRLHPQKGLIYLLKAMVLVIREIKNVYLILVGDGKLKKYLKNESKKLKLADKIIFKGELKGKKLIKEYKTSHLFVLPSIYEGQPLTLLEAWAAKIPVVVTDVGANKNFVENGKNGYLVSPKNPKALAEKIIFVLKNQNWDFLGENGYKMVKKNYSWDSAVEKTYQVYLKVLNK